MNDVTRKPTGFAGLRAARETSKHWSRRRFLQASAAAWATVNVLPRHVLGAPGQTAPSEKLNLAAVGVGGVGFGQVQACEKEGFKVVALCDVDDVYAKKAFDKWPAARRYRDFREMLPAERDKIDAVYVGTPDHTHALVTLAALSQKKHVCCVKPLTRTIYECRLVMDAARKMGVATQVTAAPNTSDAACRTCELIAAGAIGAVREVHVWSNRPLWPQGMLRPRGEDPIPAAFDWDLWLGPAPMRPFKDKWPENHYAVQQIAANHGRPSESQGVYHPWNFRGWWDFGTGALGDMGCHHLNTVFRALKLAHPVRVEATTTRVLEESPPLASIVTYEFPARADLPPARVVWYDGGLKPPRPLEMEDRSLPAEGVLYVGEEGKMLGRELLAPGRAQQFAGVPKTLPRRGGTWAEWSAACRGGEPAGCPFDWAGLLTETVLLGNIAIRAGKPIVWDAELARVSNVESANRYIQEPCRYGWAPEPI